MPHCFCRVLGGRSSFFGYRPERHARLRVLGHRVDDLAPLAVRQETLAAERYAGVSTTVCRRVHITTARASMASASMALNLGPLTPKFLEVARETLAGRASFWAPEGPGPGKTTRIGGVRQCPPIAFGVPPENGSRVGGGGVSPGKWLLRSNHTRVGAPSSLLYIWWALPRESARAEAVTGAVSQGPQARRRG